MTITKFSSQEESFIRTVTYVYLRCGQYDKANVLLNLQLKTFATTSTSSSTQSSSTQSNSKQSSSTQRTCWQQLAYCYYQQKDYDSALHVCEKLCAQIRDEGIADNSSHLALQLLISLCHLQQRQHAAARDAYQNFLNLRSQ